MIFNVHLSKIILTLYICQQMQIRVQLHAPLGGGTYAGQEKKKKGERMVLPRTSAYIIVIANFFIACNKYLYVLQHSLVVGMYDNRYLGGHPDQHICTRRFGFNVGLSS